MLTPSQEAMHKTFQRHVEAELNGDMETTMATLADNPHIVNVPTVVGAFGKEGVRDFYANHLVGKFFPPDVEMINVSLTVGETQIVEELIIKFTHTEVIEWMLPGVAPTGRKVEVAFAVVVGFDGDKVTHEHIYWDQACVLVQLGLLDPTGLPVSGVESARQVLDPSLPPRRI